ncbi:MAG: hypothetical protein ACRDRX_08880 [Pseudonocardiaceae bacterium]
MALTMYGGGRFLSGAGLVDLALRFDAGMEAVRAEELLCGDETAVNVISKDIDDDGEVVAGQPQAEPCARYDKAVHWDVIINQYRDWHEGNHPGYKLATRRSRVFSCLR